MRYINQIRKHISLAAAVVLSGCMLFGCTRADVTSSSQDASAKEGSVGQSAVNSSTADSTLAGAGRTSGQNSLTVSESKASPSDQTVEGSASGAGDAAGASSSGADNTAGTSASGTGNTAVLVTGQTAQTVRGTTTPAVSQTQETSAVPAQTDAAKTPEPDETEPPVEEPPVEEPPAEEFSASGAFNGEFEKSDGEETVMIAVTGSSQISFQFAISGIGASAQAEGNSAVYTGDDGYSITFSVSGDTLVIAISGEDGHRSAMNGTYYRVLDGGGDSWDGGQEAGQEAGQEEYDFEDDDDQYDDVEWVDAAVVDDYAG